MTASRDMTAFFRSHDRRSGRVFRALFATSAALAVGIFGYGLARLGDPVAVLGSLWLSILFLPLALAALWAGSALMSASRPARVDGRLWMQEDDARDVARVANAGAVFVIGIGMVILASQLGFALMQFEAWAWLVPGRETLGRTVLAASGLLMAYFGNAWARMPTPRAAERKPEIQARLKRTYAWIIVVHGVLLALVGLTVPRGAMAPVALGLSLTLVAGLVASAVRLAQALRAPRAT